MKRTILENEGEQDDHNIPAFDLSLFPKLFQVDQ
jgi:hypothetical protein